MSPWSPPRPWWQARVKDSIERIVEQAKRLAQEGEGEGGKSDTAGEQAIRNELSSLYATLVGGAAGVDPEDLK